MTPNPTAIRGGLTTMPVDNKDLGHLQTYLDDEHCALLIVDMQRSECEEIYYKRDDVSPLEKEIFFSTLKSTVIPNISNLLEKFRVKQKETGHKRIIHLAVRPQLEDGTDLSPRLLPYGLFHLHPVPRSDRMFEFVDELKPMPDEIVIEKTTISAFMSSNIAQVLRENKITRLFTVGLVSQNCVLSTVLNAYDEGFQIVLAEDACFSFFPKLHDAAMQILRARFAEIVQVNPKSSGWKEIFATGEEISTIVEERKIISKNIRESSHIFSAFMAMALQLMGNFYSKLPVGKFYRSDQEATKIANEIIKNDLGIAKNEE